MPAAAQSQALIDVGRFLFERGWVPATSGNLSARVDEASILITASGRHKGELTPDGLLLADLDGKPLEPGKKPSAETALHTGLYRRDAAVGAVLHTHSPLATVLSRRHVELVFEGYEIQKAFPGIDSHESRVVLPVFANDQDIPRLAAEVFADERVRHGFLIAGHGLYTWGRTVAEARRHIEAFEFLFECFVIDRQVQGAAS